MGLCGNLAEEPAVEKEEDEDGEEEEEEEEKDKEIDMNKRSELISKCRHENKFYLRNN